MRGANTPFLRPQLAHLPFWAHALHACRPKRCLAVTECSLIAYQLTKLLHRSHGGAILGRLSGEPLK